MCDGVHGFDISSIHSVGECYHFAWCLQPSHLCLQISNHSQPAHICLSESCPLISLIKYAIDVHNTQLYATAIDILKGVWLQLKAVCGLYAVFVLPPGDQQAN